MRLLGYYLNFSISKSIFGIFIGICVFLTTAVPAETAVSTTWVYPDRDFRISLIINANGHVRTNKIIEYDINFETELTNLGAIDTFDEASVRVAEITSTGTLINSEVTFQFDNGAVVDEPNGTLVFLMDGTTNANSSRYYQIYFDSSGTFSAPNPMTDLVDRQSDGGYRGQNSFIIHTKDDASTINTAYYYHKNGGGFASIYDRDGNDWVSYYQTANSQSGGEFRGIPNLGDVFHPGYNDTSGSSMKSSSAVIEDGPLRLTIQSVSHDGEWTARWDIFPTYARMTILDIPDDEEYWFLYEGTPGGNLEYTGQDQDLVVRSDGSSGNAGTAWAVEDQELGPFSNETIGEWVYFADATLDRVFFIAHSNDDTEPDLYRAQYDNDQTSPPGTDDNGAMTVFGYGRKSTTGTNRHLEALNAQFSIGFGESKVHNDATAVIHNASQDVLITRNNELPTVDSNSGFSLNEGASITILNTHLAGSDPEGGTVSYELMSLPEHGSLELNSTSLLVGETFSQIDIDSGNVSYAHNGDESTSDSIDLQIRDHAQAGDQFSIAILINGVNDPPIGFSDTSIAVSNLGSVTIDVLNNDEDSDGPALSVQSITQPANGTAVINEDDTVTYTPNPNYDGIDSFTYITTDGTLSSSPTTVTITVKKAQTIYLPLVIK